MRPPTADVADFEVAARGENNMPKIPDAADEIEVLCAAKNSWEERQLQTTHLPHTPTRKEAARSSLQPHRRRHVAGSDPRRKR